MQLSDLQSAFLNFLIHALGHFGANPIFLRNYDGIPREIGHDIDIWIRPSSKYISLQLIHSIARLFGQRVVHEHRRAFVDALYVEQVGVIGGWMHIDLYHGALTWHGYPFLNADCFIARSTPFRSYRIPCKAHEAYLLGMVSILWGGFVKDIYIPRIRNLTSDLKDRSIFTRLVYAYGGHLANSTVHRLTGLASHDADSSLAVAARKRVRELAYRRNVLAALTYNIVHWFWEAYNYLLRRPGLYVRLSADPDTTSRLTESIMPLFGESIEIGKGRGFVSSMHDIYVAFRRRGTGWLIVSRRPVWGIREDVGFACAAWSIDIQNEFINLITCSLKNKSKYVSLRESP